MRIIVIILTLLFCNTCYAELEGKPTQKEVKFTITYNSITLERATELEKVIRQSFKDACSLDITLGSNIQGVSSSQIWYPNTDNIITITDVAN